MDLKVKNSLSYENTNNATLDSINYGNNQAGNDNVSDENTIVSIISNKGGVGKTSFAVASGMFLSQKMKKSTLLIELDSSPGDFSVLFDIEKDMSLELALKFPEQYSRFVKKIYRNMDVLKGISSPLIAENVKKDSMNKLLNYISRDYNFIIIDTQTVINGPVLDVLRLSSEILIISEYSLESFARISKLKDILIKKFFIPESKMKLIINKKKLKHFFKIWDITKFIELPVYGFIKFDKRFNQSRLIFNKASILKTNFFREISKLLLMIYERPDRNVKG